MEWTLSNYTRQTYRAMSYADKICSILPIYGDIPPSHITPDGERIVYLNPIVIGYRLVCKASAPKWFKNKMQGYCVTCDNTEDSPRRENKAKMSAYQIAVDAILRHWGFTRYIQDELPF